MTLDEYLNQDPPARLSPGEVLIDQYFWKELIHVSSPMNWKFGGKTIEIRTVSFKYHGEWFTYRTDTGDKGLLWTMDEHGNKKSRSVFKIKPY